MKILIIRFSSIGDIVLTTPVIRNLKEQLPGSEIHYCTKTSFKGIVESNPFVDKVHVLENSLKNLIHELRKEKFDYLIDLHNNLRTRIIKSSLKAKAYSFDKLNFKKWLLVKFKVNKMPNSHVVDRYMDTVKPLGVSNDQLGLDYFIPEKDEIEKEWLPEQFRKGYIAFVIGAAHATKKLPVERMIELCDRINKPIVLVGGKEDKANGEIIENFFKRRKENEDYEPGLEKLNKKAEIFNACGKFNLNQSASLVKNAKLVFSHDTGLMHIAAAFKKEIVSIWGNTTPFFGFYPYKTKFTVLENNKIGCRPCSKIGYNKCPKGHFKCMNDLVFDFYIKH